MEYDNTLYLEKSTNWVMDLTPAETVKKEMKDGQTVTIYYFNVRRRKDAPIVTDHPEYCTELLRVHNKRIIELKHMIGLTSFFILRVEIRTYYIKNLGSLFHCTDVIPFKDPNGRYTCHYKESIERAIKGYGMTIKHCAELCDTTPAIVRDINKKRLEIKAGLMKPTLEDNIKHIAVDEFLLGNNYVYCTIIICAETGKLLWLSPGKGKAQIADFFKWVGDAFMRNVETISMDMNATYSSAILDSAWKYPNLKIVYDKFHIIKMYNDNVITSVRKAEERKLTEAIAIATKQGDEAKASELLKARSTIKYGKLLLLANRATLIAKDSLNKRINEVNTRKDNYGQVTRRVDNEKRYKELLDSNETLQNVCRLREELQNILRLDDTEHLGKALDAWIAEASRYNITSLTSFAKTMKKRRNGIVTKAKCHLENGKIEGVNGFIKALRRTAFGLPDFDYFALLLWEQCEDMRRRALEKRMLTTGHKVSFERKATEQHKITKASTKSWMDKTVFDCDKYPADDWSPILQSEAEKLLPQIEF